MSEDIHQGEVPEAGADFPEVPTPGVPAAAGWQMRWQIPLFLLSLLVWCCFLWIGHRREMTKRESPRLARGRIVRAFEACDYERVIRHAEVFRELYPKHEKRAELELYAARSAFVLGESVPERSTLYYEEAGGFVRSALLKPLREDQRFLAEEILARSCMRLGDYRQAVLVTRKIRKEFPGRERELRLLQARGEFRLDEVDAARETIQGYLASPDIGEEEKVDAYMELGEGFRLAGHPGQAEQNFRRVIGGFAGSARVKEAHFKLGLALVQAAGERAELLDDAKAEFETVLRMMPIHEGIERKAGLYIGECLYRGQEFDAAVRALQKVASVHGGTPEGVAAGLRVASIRVNEGKFDEAREALTSVLTQVPEGGKLTNEYVSAGEINSVWRAVLRHYLTKAQYEELERLNQDTRKLARHGVYLYQQASLYRHHADELRDEAQQLRELGGNQEAVGKEQEARFNFQRAGRLLVRLVNGVESELELHAKALQQAAECLYEAGDYAGAVVYYRLFEKSGGEQKDKQRTLVRCARALQALGRHKKALEELEKCVRGYGSTPSGYEAMLARTESYIAMGELANAERALGEIVYHDELFSPSGKVWCRALTELAYVLYAQGRFKEAVPKLDEILTREGALGSARFTRLEATYYLADAYRNVGSIEPAARRMELKGAARHFAEVREMGLEEAMVSSPEAGMVRTSHVAEADCRYELGDYTTALRLYEHAAEKFLDSVEGVRALFGIAACLHKVGEFERAALAADRARWSAGRLKASSPEHVTKFQENAWNAMVAWHIAGNDS